MARLTSLDSKRNRIIRWHRLQLYAGPRRPLSHRHTSQIPLSVHLQLPSSIIYVA